eukprot:gene9044-2658_t
MRWNPRATASGTCGRAAAGAAAAAAAELVSLALAQLLSPVGLPVCTLPFCVAAIAANAAHETVSSRFHKTATEALRRLGEVLNEGRSPTLGDRSPTDTLGGGRSFTDASAAAKH